MFKLYHTYENLGGSVAALTHYSGDEYHFYFRNKTCSIIVRWKKATMVVVSRTKSTPQVDFERNLINIQGRLIPTNYTSFHHTLRNFFRKIKNSGSTTINFNLDYINASSKKFMVETFSLFEKKHEKGSNMIINWYYEEGDEDMYDLGLIYKSIIKIPFKLIKIKKGDQ